MEAAEEPGRDPRSPPAHRAQGGGAAQRSPVPEIQLGHGLAAKHGRAQPARSSPTGAVSRSARPPRGSCRQRGRWQADRGAGTRGSGLRA